VSLIGATTFRENREYIEKDRALRRRLQPVKLRPLTVDETINVLRGLKDLYQKHHKLEITDEALVAAARLTDRYITEFYLPDKAIDAVDMACSRLVVAKHKSGGKITATTIGAVEIEAVVSKMSGVDLGRIHESEREKLLNLDSRIHERIVGQDQAVSKLAKAVRVARAGLKDPNRPIGCFLFMGPTGVGKTEVAKALQWAYFDKRELIRLDMSEYMEKHSIARMIGSPPGYVGYGEGGRLTEAVRKNPNCVLLFDEIEKAHPDVFNILLQIMDHGRLEDAEGNPVDFKNVILIITTNVGSDQVEREDMGFGTRPKSQSGAPERVMDQLKKSFSPEFLNRLDDIILFHKLIKAHLGKIVENLMAEVQQLLDPRKIKLDVTAAAKDLLVRVGTNEEYGARPLKRAIHEYVKEPLADLLLAGDTIHDDMTVVVDAKGDELTFRPAGEDAPSFSPGGDKKEVA
jgi:ATP-dependent Clp protease ATP-binding subunit ClpC